VFIVPVIYFVIDSARKLLDTPLYEGRGSKNCIQMENVTWH